MYNESIVPEALVYSIDTHHATSYIYSDKITISTLSLCHYNIGPKQIIIDNVATVYTAVGLSHNNLIRQPLLSLFQHRNYSIVDTYTHTYLLYSSLCVLLPANPPVCSVASLRHLRHSKEVAQGSANDTSATTNGLA